MCYSYKDNQFSFWIQGMLLNESVWNILKFNVQYFVVIMLKLNKQLCLNNTNFKQLNNTCNKLLHYVYEKLI